MLFVFLEEALSEIFEYQFWNRCNWDQVLLSESMISQERTSHATRVSLTASIFVYLKNLQALLSPRQIGCRQTYECPLNLAAPVKCNF